MQERVDIFLGSPLEIESERTFLSRLSSDLRERGVEAVILANFILPTNPLQIDFLVGTSKCACHIELKHLTAPVVGKENGPWCIKSSDGGLEQLAVKNPYRQALFKNFPYIGEFSKG